MFRKQGETNTKFRITAIVSVVQRRGINWGWAHQVLLRFDHVLLLPVGARMAVVVCSVHVHMIHFLRVSHREGYTILVMLQNERHSQPSNFRKLGMAMYMDDNFLVTLYAEKKIRKIHQNHNHSYRWFRD